MNPSPTLPRPITSAELIQRGACEEGSTWFEAVFPDGKATVAEVLDRCVTDQWVVWLACERHPEIAYTWASLACTWASETHPEIVAYANITRENIPGATATAAQLNGPVADVLLACLRLTLALDGDHLSTSVWSVAREAAKVYEAFPNVLPAFGLLSAFAVLRVTAEAWLLAGRRPALPYTSPPADLSRQAELLQLVDTGCRDEDDPETEDLVWVLDPAFPLELLAPVIGMTEAELWSWLETEQQGRTDQAWEDTVPPSCRRGERYFDSYWGWWSSESACEGGDVPTIILRPDLVFKIWDGWHRTIIARLARVRTAPMLVGIPRALLPAC